MECVYTVGKRLVREVFPFHCERISIEPENVIRVYLADGWLEPVVKRGKSMVQWIARLVDRVVTSYPCIVLVSFCDLFPKPDRPVLMVLVVPESSVVGGVVRMPVSILSTRYGMHVQDGIDLVFGTLWARLSVLILLVMWLLLPDRQPDQGA